MRRDGEKQRNNNKEFGRDQCRSQRVKKNIHQNKEIWLGCKIQHVVTIVNQMNCQGNGRGKLKRKLTGNKLTGKAEL